MIVTVVIVAWLAVAALAALVLGRMMSVAELRGDRSLDVAAPVTASVPALAR